MKRIYLCTNSCNTVTTAAPWGLSSVECRLVKMTTAIAFQHMAPGTAKTGKSYVAVLIHGKFRLPRVAAHSWQWVMVTGSGLHNDNKYSGPSTITEWFSFVTITRSYYSAPSGVLSIMITRLSVHLSLCPRAYLWNRWTDLHEILFVDPLWPWLGPPQRHCAMLCTSGFMDDVTFGVMAATLARVGSTPHRRSIMCVTRVESAVYECLSFITLND